jgi:hypothetical protein
MSRREQATTTEAVESGKGRQRVRTLAGWALTALGFLLVWFALVGPNRLNRLTPGEFFRLPVEGLILVAVAIALPSRPRTIVAAVAGVLLGLLTLVRILDMGFYDALDRPFNPVTDWSYLGPAVGVLRDSIGSARTLIAELAVVLLVLAVLILLPLAVIRLTRITARHRRSSARTVAALSLVWIALAAFGLRAGSDAPFASRSAAGLAVDQVDAVGTAIKDQRTFDSALAAPDPYAITPGAQLLTGLRGKDVLIAVVESYGQVAVQGTSFSPGVDAVLNAGTTQLNAAGFSARSAFLSSPTFGGASWLAHSTLQSGLWIDNQQRYDKLVASDRLTLTDAFERGGWRTVGDVPSNTGPWPEGTSFYHFDQLYNEHNVGYAGPKFSYAAMPDQYTLSAFQRLELSKLDRKPVMAELDLVSSHTPWTPLPHMVDWDQVGDGSVFNGMPAEGKSPSQVWPNQSRVRAVYGQSIQYSLTSLISFVQTSHDDNLVMVVYGDHQPATIVSGNEANHDVPITIIAHDPKVLDQIASWGWQDGMLPNPQAPVWAMDAFRDRFLSAYAAPSH